MSANVAMKTVFKMFGVPLDGKIAREDFKKYVEHERDGVKGMNPTEAEKVYRGIMLISDIFGLDKYAKDGGMSYTIREFEIVRRIVARKDLPEANRVLHSAYFKAIDTNEDQFLQRMSGRIILKFVRPTPARSKQCSHSIVSTRTKME